MWWYEEKSPSTAKSILTPNNENKICGFRNNNENSNKTAANGRPVKKTDSVGNVWVRITSKNEYASSSGLRRIVLSGGQGALIRLFGLALSLTFTFGWSSSKLVPDVPGKYQHGTAGKSGQGEGEQICHRNRLTEFLLPSKWTPITSLKLNIQNESKYYPPSSIFPRFRPSFRLCYNRKRRKFQYREHYALRPGTDFLSLSDRPSASFPWLGHCPRAYHA